DSVSGRGRTARVAPGGQPRRRAAAGEAGAADLPEREDVAGDDVSTPRRTQSPKGLEFAAPASPAAARLSHAPPNGTRSLSPSDPRRFSGRPPSPAPRASAPTPAPCGAGAPRSARRPPAPASSPA